MWDGRQAWSIGQRDGTRGGILNPTESHREIRRKVKK